MFSRDLNQNKPKQDNVLLRFPTVKISIDIIPGGPWRTSGKVSVQTLATGGFCTRQQIHQDLWNQCILPNHICGLIICCMTRSTKREAKTAFANKEVATLLTRRF